MALRVLDVFSCIGFHALGLQRAGDFEIVALCESNERRRQELSIWHPGTPIHDDIRTMPVVSADIIFGGPPCQATSVAAAIHGYRSGGSLWPYMLCAGLDAGVEWFVVEQPPGNAAWEAQVHRHLSATGYHSARFEFGAEDVGAPYPRRRVYILACTSLQRLEIAWQAGPSAIDRAKRAAIARGDWDPHSIPTFDLDAWRAEDVLERREAIEALGDSNPPAMAEVIGYMVLAALTATDGAAARPTADVIWVNYADNGNIRLWTSDQAEADRLAGRGMLLKPFCAAPPAPEVKAEAVEPNDSYKQGFIDGKYEAEATVPWPHWAEQIREQLRKYGIEAGTEGEWDIGEDFCNWLDGWEQSIREECRASPPAPAQEIGDQLRIVRHKKRGSTYEVIGVGKMQAGWTDISKPIDSALRNVDMREVTIYRSLDDGALWVRPVEEFNDGRFEAIGRFQYFSDEHIAVLPAGAKGPLDNLTTVERNASPPPAPDFAAGRIAGLEEAAKVVEDEAYTTADIRTDWIGGKHRGSDSVRKRNAQAFGERSEALFDILDAIRALKDRPND